MPRREIRPEPLIGKAVQRAMHARHAENKHAVEQVALLPHDKIQAQVVSTHDKNGTEERAIKKHVGLFF